MYKLNKTGNLKIYRGYASEGNGHAFNRGLMPGRDWETLLWMKVSTALRNSASFLSTSTLRHTSSVHTWPMHSLHLQGCLLSTHFLSTDKTDACLFRCRQTHLWVLTVQSEETQSLSVDINSINSSQSVNSLHFLCEEFN